MKKTVKKLGDREIQISSWQFDEKLKTHLREMNYIAKVEGVPFLSKTRVNKL